MKIPLIGFHTLTVLMRGSSPHKAPPWDIYKNKKAGITKYSFGNSAIYLLLLKTHPFLSSYDEDLGFSGKLLG